MATQAFPFSIRRQASVMSKYLLDPWWPAIMVVAGVVTLIACGVLALGAFSLVMAFNQARQTPILDVSFDPYNLFVVVIYLFIPFALWRWAWLARDRMWRRAQVIAGDPGAMPVALLATTAQQTLPPPNNTTDAPIAAAPLRIAWRERAAWRWLTPTTILAITFFVSMISMMLIFGVAIVLAAIGNPLADIGAVVGLLAVGFTLVVVSVRRLTARQLSPDQHVTELIADEVGLTWLRPRRRAVVIPWAAARLLEVSMANGGADDWRVIQLYGIVDARPRMITWLHASAPTKPPPKQPADYAPVAMTLAELAQHQGALLALIRRRTGLTPHTFDDALTNSDAIQAWFQAMLTAANVFWFAVLGIAPLIAAPLILVLPLTRYPLANVYAALTVSGVGIGFLTLFVGARIKRIGRRRSATHAATLAPYALPTASPNVENLYTLSALAPTRGRILSGLFGLGCLLDGGVGGLSWSAPGRTFPTGTFGHSLLELSGSALLLVGAFGVFIISVDTLRPIITVYSARHEDFVLRRGARLVKVIRWSDIVSLAALQQKGRVIGFEVITDSGDSIDWPRNGNYRYNTAPVGGGFLRVTPDELAALVVARTGCR